MACGLLTAAAPGKSRQLFLRRCTNTVTCSTQTFKCLSGLEKNLLRWFCCLIPAPSPCTGPHHHFQWAPPSHPPGVTRGSVAHGKSNRALEELKHHPGKTSSQGLTLPCPAWGDIPCDGGAARSSSPVFQDGGQTNAPPNQPCCSQHALKGEGKRRRRKQSSEAGEA